MKKMIHLKSLAAPLAAILSVALLSGCNEEENIQAQKWEDTITQYREAAEKEIPNTPYHAEQHQAFQNYFGEIASITLKVVEDQGMANKFNQVISRSDLGQLCPKIFIPRTDWEVLMKKCTKNTFFLCADEVKAYVDMVKALRERMEAKNQQRFNETKPCLAAIE